MAAKGKSKKGSAGNLTVEASAPAAPGAVTDKPKRGRPTKYLPEYCDLVLELGEQGKSKAQMARTIGVTRETLDEWAKRYPEFSDAIKGALELSLAWWEDAGQQGMFLGAKGFNSTAYIFQVKNRFKADYRDTQDHNLNPGEGFAALFSLVGTGKADALMRAKQ